VSQVEPLVHVLGDVLARGQLTGDFTRLANGSVSMAPHGVYPARGIDQWIAIAVPDDQAWRALAALAGLDAEQYPTLERRMAAAGEIDAALGDWTAGQDKHVLADRLAAAGVAAEAVNDGRDVFTDAELIAGGHFVAIDHAVLGHCDMPAPPAHFSRSEVVVGRPPRLGEHNRTVFVEMLGIDPAEIEDLVATGALA
jgi:benzylsuccinate CoA-transferase BbsF subunit